MSFYGGSRSYTVDPSEIELRVADMDAVSTMENYIQGLLKEENDDHQIILDRIREAIDTLPDREADFVDLYYFTHKTQTEIAYLFRVSQPTVCYRLQRAAKRIHFLLSLPTIGMEMLGEMEKGLAQILKDPEDVRIMIQMYQTSCQSVVAKALGVSQGKIRHRLMRSIRMLEKHKGVSEQYAKYHQMFSLLASKPNIRREVQRPTSSSKMRRILDCDPTPSTISEFEVLSEEDTPSPVVPTVSPWVFEAWTACSFM